MIKIFRKVMINKENSIFQGKEIYYVYCAHIKLLKIKQALNEKKL